MMQHASHAQGKGAVLRQCALLLQLAALQLHRADLAVLAHREDCNGVLAVLFDVALPEPDAGETPGAFLGGMQV